MPPDGIIGLYLHDVKWLDLRREPLIFVVVVSDYSSNYLPTKLKLAYVVSSTYAFIYGV